MDERADYGSQREILDAAMADYESTRDDERAFLSAQAAMFGVLVAIVAAVAAVYREVSPQVLAVALVAPVAVILYLQIIGTQAVIRSFYLRDLEKRIHELMPRPSVELVRGGDDVELMLDRDAYEADGAVNVDEPIATYASVMVGIISLRRGDPTYRALVAAIIGIILAIFGGLAVFVALQVPGWVRVAMLVVYGGSAVFLIAAQRRISVHGKQLYENARAAVAAERAATLLGAQEGRRATSTGERARAADDRSLLSYLVLPRPNDLVKWAILPLTWLLIALGLDEFNWSDFGIVVFATVLLEWGIYSARYQLNDIRGLPSDVGHPEARRRGRLPVPSADPATWSKPIQASLAVAIARIALVFLIVASLDLRALPIVVAAVICVFVVAVGYEWLRSRATSTESGSISLKPSVWDRATWVVVTSGYGVRAGLAVALLVYLGGTVNWQVATLSVMYIAALGAVFVYQTWVLEGTGLIARSGTGEAAEVVADRTAKDKTHVLRLTRFALRELMSKESIRVDTQMPGFSAPCVAGESATGSPYESLRTVRVMVERVTFASPWSVALVVTLGIGAALGVALDSPRVLPIYAIAVPLAVVLALVLAAVRTGAVLFAFFTVVVIAMEAWLVLAGATWVAGVPVVVGAAVYLAFSVQTYESLSKPVAAHVDALVKATKWLMLSVLAGRIVRDRVWPQPGLVEPVDEQGEEDANQGRSDDRAASAS